MSWLSVVPDAANDGVFSGLNVTGPEGSGPDVGGNGSVVVPRETGNGKYMISPW